MPLETPEIQDIIWVLICAILVLMMQPGFLCLESGMVRSKNSINVAMKNLMDLCVVGLGFLAVGYGLMFGSSHLSLFGVSGYFLSGIDDPWALTLFFFQLVFCATAVTIISGAIAERVPVTGYLAIALLTTVLIYPLMGHWSWAVTANGDPAGWLSQRGFIDFAGSTVVHSTGAWVALAALLVIGPRIGRFDSHGKDIQGHNLPLSALGVMLLWFGWFGFNGGSLLEANDRIPLVFLNTAIGGMAGGGVACLLSWSLKQLIDARIVMTGIIAGLVSITASCNAIQPIEAIVIGSIGALVCSLGSTLLVHLKIDDAVDAVPVHGFAGVWGTLSVGLFGDLETLGTGLGRIDQIVVQITGIATNFGWAFGVSFVVLWSLNRWISLRVSTEHEEAGLNVTEHGATTEILDLLRDMERQSKGGDLSQLVPVEPHTEVGQIATQYNQVLKRVILEAEIGTEMTERAERATNAAEQARETLEQRVEELNKFNRLSIGRELHIVELKKEINELARRAGIKLPYDLTFLPEDRLGGSGSDTTDR